MLPVKPIAWRRRKGLRHVAGMTVGAAAIAFIRASRQIALDMPLLQARINELLAAKRITAALEEPECPTCGGVAIGEMTSLGSPDRRWYCCMCGAADFSLPEVSPL